MGIQGACIGRALNGEALEKVVWGCEDEEQTAETRNAAAYCFT